MSFLTNLKQKFVNISIRHGQERVRMQLLGLSNRQLADFGFSRQLLLQGTNAWPWREEFQNEPLNLQRVATAKVSAPINPQAIKDAVNELEQYSDKELSDLGINRNEIGEAVRYGRPAVEGVFENHSRVA